MSETPTRRSRRASGHRTPRPAPEPVPDKPWINRYSVTTWSLALVVVIVDQLTKAWAVAALSDGHRVRLLGPVLSLVLLRNPGAAFSFATGQTWVFTLIAIVVALLVIRISRRLGTQWWAVTLGLVLGGAVGNLIDRLVRSPGVFRGHVVDFIDYGGLFVGNVADIAIVGAAFVMLGMSLLGLEITGRRQGISGHEEERGEEAAVAVLGEGARTGSAPEEPPGLVLAEPEEAAGSAGAASGRAGDDAPAAAAASEVDA